MKQRLEIIVDELVVHGLTPADARAAAAALETGLTTLAEAARSTVPARSESFRRLAPVTVPAAAPAALGDAVAGAVWNAVSGRGAA